MTAAIFIAGMLFGSAVTYFVAYSFGWVAAMRLVEEEIDTPKEELF